MGDDRKPIHVDDSAIGDPLLAMLYRHWSQVRPGDGFPHPDDLDRREIADALPHTLRVRVLPEGGFFYEEAGTQVHASMNPSGKTMEEAIPQGAYHDHILTQYRMALSGREGVYTLIDYYIGAGELERTLHRIFLPLSADGQSITHLIVGQTSVQDRAWHKPLWECALTRISIRQTIPLF